MAIVLYLGKFVKQIDGTCANFFLTAIICCKVVIAEKATDEKRR